VARRILIAGGGTGGHLMPALAIAAALRELDPGVEPVLVGAERGVEAKLLPTRGFRYHLLPAEPIYRRQWWKNVRWPMVAMRLWQRLRDLYREESPIAVLGTGGYASGPVVFWGARHGVPAAIQEQNAYPGVTSRLLSRFVRHVYWGSPKQERSCGGTANGVLRYRKPDCPAGSRAARSRPSALWAFGLRSRHSAHRWQSGSAGAEPRDCRMARRSPADQRRPALGHRARHAS
jgi:UDP-N-acetylglucosamine--N-acetylmuramyl-(pentapeptide) pyrophosphoryl-undecaprenol N-acetylglucosamine transferase